MQIPKNFVWTLFRESAAPKYFAWTKFRENGQNTRKSRKLILAKFNPLKVYCVVLSNRQNIAKVDTAKQTLGNYKMKHCSL